MKTETNPLVPDSSRKKTREAPITFPLFLEVSRGGDRTNELKRETDRMVPGHCDSKREEKQQISLIQVGALKEH